jgi:WD40 repeat protein
LQYTLEGHSRQAFVLDPHPFDPRIILSAGYDGRVILWDLSTGASIHGSLLSFIFSHSDRRFIHFNTNITLSFLVFSDLESRIADGEFSLKGNSQLFRVLSEETFEH